MDEKRDTQPQVQVLLARHPEKQIVRGSPTTIPPVHPGEVLRAVGVHHADELAEAAAPIAVIAAPLDEMKTSSR